MASLGFPELPHHWRLHKDFDYKIFAYIRKLETGKIISNDEVLGMVHKWLLEHLAHEDKLLRIFLEKMAGHHANR
jgi:hemerythrin